MARLISSSVEGLEFFVAQKGLDIFIQLQQQFRHDRILQARAMRALASSVEWPEHIQESAALNADHVVRNINRAMRLHKEHLSVLLAGFEGYYKFLPGLRKIYEKGTPLNMLLFPFKYAIIFRYL